MDAQSKSPMDRQTGDIEATDEPRANKTDGGPGRHTRKSQKCSYTSSANAEKRPDGKSFAQIFDNATKALCGD